MGKPEVTPSTKISNLLKRVEMLPTDKADGLIDDLNALVNKYSTQ